MLNDLLKKFQKMLICLDKINVTKNAQRAATYRSFTFNSQLLY